MISYFCYPQISEVKNLNHLLELRVLNLAGNTIGHVGNLRGMDSLTELNLRRNHITTAVSTFRYDHTSGRFLSSCVQIVIQLFLVHVNSAGSLLTFRRHLKNYLFYLAYPPFQDFNLLLIKRNSKLSVISS